MPAILSSRNVTRGHLYPLRRYLLPPDANGKPVPYSLEWTNRYFAKDIGSVAVGNTGDDKDPLLSHEVYYNFARFGDAPLDRESSIIELLYGYVYPRVLRQVIYYNLPHNPNCPSYYLYFKHLATLLDPAIDGILKACLQNWVGLADRVYPKWRPSYFTGSLAGTWDPNRDVREFDKGIVWGDYGSGVYVPGYPNPPIPHPFTSNGSDPLGYVRDFGPQVSSFDEDYSKIVYLPYVGYSDPVPPAPTPVTPDPIPVAPVPPPAPEPIPVAPVPPPSPEPIPPAPVPEPEPVPTTPMSGKTKELLENLYARVQAGALLSDAQILLLENYGFLSVDQLYQTYLNNPTVLKVSELQLLALRGKIDRGAVFTGRSRR